jgi:outer membrane protein with beta-barrel domain
MKRFARANITSFPKDFKSKLLPIGAALLLFAALPAHAQLVQWGVKAGVPVTENFATASGLRQSFTSSTNRYVVGPTVEVALPHGFGFELDALYKRLHFNGTTTSIDVVTQEKTTANSWEFPLLLKYKPTEGGIRPFVDAGVSFHSIADVKQLVSTRVIPRPVAVVTATDNPPELNDNFNAGFVLGGGIELRAPLIHISPEIRYTRWGSENFRSPSGFLNSSQNQVEFLVGFTF